MLFPTRSSVLLTADVKGGRVGDECVVVSSKNGWYKVKLLGMDYDINVRASQITVKECPQLSLYNRWEIDAE